jgi:hypothetical protein
MSIVMQQHNTFWQLISAFTLKHVMQHFTAIYTIYCHPFVGWDLDFTFTGLCVFPVHTLTFALWLSVVDWCSTINGIETQKHVSLAMIPFQKAITYVQTSIPVLFWNTSCTNFVEVKSMVGDFISRTMTNLHLVCHFASSHCPVVQKKCADLFSVFFSG